MVVRRLADARAIPTCQVLFVSSSVGERLPSVLAQTVDAPTLTVGDTDEFTRLGGCVRFFFVDNRLRFEVNMKCIERADLEVSSKLLRLATITGGEARHQ
jgi:hypothetical protein